MSEDFLDSEEDFSFIDAADVIEEKEKFSTSGETVPYTIDPAVLSAFENFDIDDFETKFYPVAKKSVEKKKNPFLSGESKFFESTQQEEVEPIDLEEHLKLAQNDWQKSTPRGRELVDMQTTDVVKIDKKLKREFVNNLGDNIEAIKDFLIHQTAPTELAVSNAFEQSRQTLETILGVKLEGTSRQLKAMINDSVILKTFDFIAKSLNLDDQHKQIIINKYFVLSITKTTKRVK